MFMCGCAVHAGVANYISVHVFVFACVYISVHVCDDNFPVTLKVTLHIHFITAHSGFITAQNV